MIPSKEENPNGLHRRYKVLKADGSEPDPRALYFVLRIDPYGDDQEHTEACWVAAAAYCGWIRATVAEGDPLRLVAEELSELLLRLTP